MRSTHKVGIKKVDIELVCFFQSEKNAGALSCVLICILLISAIFEGVASKMTISDFYDLWVKGSIFKYWCITKW